MKDKLYSVVSPEMWEIVPVLDDGTGPKEYFRDYVEVLAKGPIEAKVKAVKTKAFTKWRVWCRDGEESPYEGLSARRRTTASA